MELTEAQITGLPWQRVTSGNVKRIAYEPAGVDDELGQIGDAFVEFHSGAIYRYAAVNGDAFKELVAADLDDKQSVGSTLHRVIKGRYAHERVTVKPEGEA